MKGLPNDLRNMEGLQMICHGKISTLFTFLLYFRGMPVAGHGKVSPDFLFLCRRKTANLIDK